VPVIRRAGTGIGQDKAQGQITQGLLVVPFHLKVMKQIIEGETLHSNNGRIPTHPNSIVRSNVLKRRKRREVEEEGTEVQVLVLAVAEVVIEGDRITLAALPQAHVTAHYHQECTAAMVTTSVSILAAVVPSVAVEVITRNKTNDDTKRIRRKTRRRSMKIITLDRHEMIPLGTFAAVRAL